MVVFEYLTCVEENRSCIVDSICFFTAIVCGNIF